MVTSPRTATEPTDAGRPHRRGVLSWLARAVPTALVLAALGVSMYWGHETGWDFFDQKKDPGSISTPQSPEPRPVVRLVPAPRDVRSDLPLPGQTARIEFLSASAVETAGIDITPAWPSALSEQVSAAGEVAFDSTRLARIPTRVGGVTRRVLKAVGDPVKAGEVLALIDSADVGKAKAEFQQALIQARLRERTRDDLIAAKSSTSPAALSEAEAAVKDSEVRTRAAAQTLTNLGLAVVPADYRSLTPAEALRKMRRLGAEDVAEDSGGGTANLLPVRAPFAGVVLAAEAVSGDVVEAGKALFVVVDPARVWVTLHVSSEDARRVGVGQKAFFRPDGSPREHPAAVTWVGSAADEATRTVPVRAEADNASGALRASTLGRGRVVLREEPKALVVPHEAVHPFRGLSVVFVRDPDFLKPTGAKAFHVRVVRTGGRDDRNVEILAGLSAGEIVAAKGSGVLLGELTQATAGR